MFFVEMAWAGSANAPGPLNFRGCDLTAEWLPATEHVRVRLPATAPIFFTGCASARGRVSKTQLTPGGTEAACQFHSGVVADKQCSCPASKLMWEHYPPTPPFHCGENEIQASLISSVSAGATPAPATNLREVIRLPDCKSGVEKQIRKRRTGALPALPTILDS